MDSLQTCRNLRLCLLIVGLCVFGPVQGMGQPPSSRTDYLGDPLPEGAILRLGTARLRHPGAIRRLLFTDDGKSLIAVGYETMPSAWDVETGKRIKTDATEFELLDKATGKSILARANPALWSSLAFGREGKTLLAVGYNHVVTAWDIDSGKATSKQDMGLADVLQPDEKSATKSALVRFLDPLTGQEMQKTIRLSYSWKAWKTWSLADDGKHLTFYYWGSGEMREIETGKNSVVAEGGVFDLRATLNIPKKKLAVISGWENVAVQNLENDKFIWNKEVAPPQEAGPGNKTCKVSCLALSPDGKVVAAGTDSGHIELLDLATGERAHGSRFHPGFFSGPVQFVPGGKFVIVTMGREAVVWNLSEGKIVRGLGIDSGYDPRIVSPDGLSLLVGDYSEKKYKLRLEETLSGKKLWTLDDRYGSFPEAQLSTDGKTLAIYTRKEPRQKQSVTYVSAKTGERIRTFQPPDLEPTDKKFPPNLRVKVSPEMTVATETSDRQRIELWNPPAAKELWTWTMPADCREHFQEVHFVPGGKYILARMTGRTDIKEGLFVLDAKSGKQLAGIHGFGLAGFSPDGRFVAYHVRLGTPAPDGMRVYCEVRDLQSGETTALKLESPSHPHYTWGSEACFSADSKIFAYASGDSIEFYDLQSKQRLAPPRPHSADFLEMVFAPSGSMLAAHYNDSTVILWDAQAPSR